MKRIGVLTSGGDTPGMNAAIRAVFKTGVDIDLQVMGIYHGYKGLIEGRVGYLAHADVESSMRASPTIRSIRRPFSRSPRASVRATPMRRGVLSRGSARWQATPWPPP